ncbi:hypothetical protein ACSBR2_037929 [Camellia fascicularis]
MPLPSSSSLSRLCLHRRPVREHHCHRTRAPPSIHHWSIAPPLFFTLASSDAPFIVAHKTAALTRLKSGVERVFASIDIYDQGSAYAIPPFPFSLVFFDLSEIISRLIINYLTSY